jgi:acetyltransferase-like isoleucine patch superfamily enzyme
VNLINYLKKSANFYLMFRNLKMIFKRYRYGLKNVDSTFFMAGKSRVSKDFIAGKYTFIADNCRICPKVVIGNYVMFGPEVTITGADHRFDKPGVPIIFSGRPALENTLIEDDVWIGFGSVIMAGITVGRGAIIAANSVVTKDVEPYGVYAGVPAKKIKERFSSRIDVSVHEAMLNSPSFSGKFCSRKN